MQYLLSTISVNWPDIWIWTNYPIKERDIFCIVRFLIKLQVHHILYKLSKRCRTKATKSFWRSCHLLLANKEPFVLSLIIQPCQSNMKITNRETIPCSKFGNCWPDTLARAAGHGEEKWACKQEIPSHLSCSQFVRDEHAHLHSAQFPWSTKMMMPSLQSIPYGTKVRRYVYGKTRLPKNIWPLVVINMKTSWTISPLGSCKSDIEHNTGSDICTAGKKCTRRKLPNPRSTRNNFFPSGVPGVPSKKFSGLMSPCTYLHELQQSYITDSCCETSWNQLVHHISYNMDAKHWPHPNPMLSWMNWLETSTSFFFEKERHQTLDLSNINVAIDKTKLHLMRPRTKISRHNKESKKKNPTYFMSKRSQKNISRIHKWAEESPSGVQLL